MVKNSTLIALFLMNTLFVAQLVTAAEIGYADIINPYSDFARSFDLAPWRKDKIEHLLSLCEKKNDTTWILRIKDIPQVNNFPSIQAFLKITKFPLIQKTLEEQVTEIKHYAPHLPTETSNPNEHFFSLSLNGHPTNDMEWFYESPGAVVSNITAVGNMSGSTIMNIYDRLSSLCFVRLTFVWDTSKLPENQAIDLRVLYPYIYGNTFYERYGFKPYNLSATQLKQYEQARQFLINRPLQEILQDFHDNQEVYQALLAGFQEGVNFPELTKSLENAILKDALYPPFKYIRTSPNHEYYSQLLEIINSNCLENYTCTNPQKRNRIESLQKKVNTIEYYFKFYG